MDIDVLPETQPEIATLEVRRLYLPTFGHRVGVENAYGMPESLLIFDAEVAALQQERDELRRRLQLRESELSNARYAEGIQLSYRNAAEKYADSLRERLARKDSSEMHFRRQSTALGYQCAKLSGIIHRQRGKMKALRDQLAAAEKAIEDAFGGPNPLNRLANYIGPKRERIEKARQAAAARKAAKEKP